MYGLSAKSSVSRLNIFELLIRLDVYSRMKNASLAIAILYIFLQIIIAQSTYYGCSGQSPPFDPASWPSCCSTIKIQLNLRFNLENSIRFPTFLFGVFSCNNMNAILCFNFGTCRTKSCHKLKILYRSED